MKILVTGGAGYIGSHIVLELTKSNHQVVVLDNLSTGNQDAVPLDVDFYQGDLLDKEILKRIFLEHKIDVVIHTSAKLIVPESVSQPLEYFENNVQGMITLLKAMKEHNVKNIVFSSTAAVYGNPTRTPVEEDDLKNPLSPYGTSKRSCEWLIEAAHRAYGFNYVIFRYFNVAGADASLSIGQATKGKPLTHLIPAVIETHLGQRAELLVYGTDYDTPDGTCIRDYIHVSDVAVAHVKGAEYAFSGKSNIFNLGSQSGFSVKQVIETTEKIVGQKINHTYVGRRDGDPAVLLASNLRAKSELGFTPQYSLEEMIKSDLDWRKNRRF